MCVFVEFAGFALSPSEPVGGMGFSGDAFPSGSDLIFVGFRAFSFFSFGNEVVIGEEVVLSGGSGVIVGS
ncbi:unnamed protein product [Bursaphelenchus xylophilus]|uniref:(pine wood nematode) hypothetical protein n=1 Tax=Bursaphelenchus xylophilus TaxID=6326 RepID=A0A1I7SFK1_BURXY|nr:unnamed protein product [Bursaphelenchus xylophilus]CAG9111779.1 unnamed protein product [Bursaphelenchus xylophilus]